MRNYGEEWLGFTYDVFISFKGEDTGFKFIAHLRKELFRKGIKINNVVDEEDLKIEESKVLMIVFSENYASSTWCLDELVKILECTKRNNKQLVFPIFYHVEPSDVQHQRNRYAEAMIEHENKFGKGSEEVKAWRKALSEAANCPGKHITTGDENESVFVEMIVEKVYKNIDTKPLCTDKNLVGLEPRIQEVKSLLDMTTNDDTVCMLGIYGPGGIGKTELAKALYDRIVQLFEAASFLPRVREKSNKINGLEDQQETLLSEMLEEFETEIDSTWKGVCEIKRKLQLKKVLLVLDDVDSIKTLEILAGGCDWFGPGSRVIITTRDKDLLIAHNVEKMYRMTELDYQHSLELFCWNAFQQSHPALGCEKLSPQAVGNAKGVPLALKVIGSNMYKRSLDAWNHALEGYKRIPDARIQEVLLISYNSLCETDKHVFLDIACFFKGEKIEYVEHILEEFNAISSIQVLVDKSILTIEHGCLMMHDLIQEMGREIVRREAQNPGQRSRLWCWEEVIQVLSEDSGSENIEGILLDPPHREKVDWSGTAFEKMKWLRILIVRNTTFSSEPKHLPSHLRVLEWEEYPSRSFPPKFRTDRIIHLNLHRSHLTFEEPFKIFLHLINMDLSHNQSVIEMPDMSGVQNLRELRLDNCMNLIALHESAGFLPNLVHLSASGCTKLRIFLPCMFLPSLEVLDLNFCTRLEHFPDIIRQMNKPLKIYMMNTAIKELPDSIGNLTGLVSIETSSSRKLKYLPSSLFMLPNFDTIKLGGCSELQESFRNFVQNMSAAIVSPSLRTLYFENGGLSDEDLDVILNCFPKLEELVVSQNDFVSLPASIKACIHLTSLDVSFCEKLQKIPECTVLRILNTHGCVNLKDVSNLDSSSLRKVDARYCFSLTRESSDMLWSQLAQARSGVEIVMPKTEIPEWFDFIGNGGNPHFWTRAKFPLIALALVFHGVSETRKPYDSLSVELNLVINGQYVRSNGYYKSLRIAADHVLVCDLRVLFGDREWRYLDTFLEHDWNLVQVSYKAASTLTLTCWGVSVCRRGINMEDVQFICPDTKYSDISIMSPSTKDRKQKQVKIIEKFDGISMETMEYEERDDFAGKQTHTLEDVAVKDEVEATMDVGEASTSGHIWEEAAEGNDGHEQQEIFIDGMVDGLVEAKSSFPNLDIAKTLTAALDKMTQHWVTLAGSYPEVEMKVYKEGIMCGLQEASLSFPNMDKEATLNAVLNTETQSYDEAAMVLREYEGSDSEEEHESDHWQQEMRRILWEGMADGLLEAIKTFPALDIQTTIRTALNKKTWLPPNLQVEVNIYIKGIVKGLREAKLTFPTLDIQATLNVVLSRETHKGPPETDTEAPVLQDSWEGKALTELYWKLEEQYKALRNKLENGIAAMDTDSCTSNFPSMSRTQLDDELNSQSPPASNCRVMHSDIGSERVDSEYEKLAAILKGRAEDIGRLDIEDFRNSKEFQDELSAIYMNGLRDGLLEAKKATITPVFNENEELVTEEEAKEEDNVKDVDNENIKNIVVAAAKRTGDSLNHEVITETELPSKHHPMASVGSSHRSKRSSRWIKKLFGKRKGTKLTSQMENLTRKTQLQEVEVERRTKQPNHETAIAEEEIAKFWTDYAEQDLVWGIDISRTGISTGASSSAYSFWESPPPFKTSARRSFSAPPSRIQTSPPPFKTSARRSFSAPPSRIQTSPPPFKTSARKSFTASPPWIQTLPPPLSPAAPVFEMSAWESFSASPSQIQISPPRIQIPSPPRALPLLK